MSVMYFSLQFLTFKDTKNTQNANLFVCIPYLGCQTALMTDYAISG